MFTNLWLNHVTKSRVTGRGGVSAKTRRRIEFQLMAVSKELMRKADRQKDGQTLQLSERRLERRTRSVAAWPGAVSPLDDDRDKWMQVEINGWMQWLHGRALVAA